MWTKNDIPFYLRSFFAALSLLQGTSASSRQLLHQQEDINPPVPAAVHPVKPAGQSLQSSRKAPSRGGQSTWATTAAALVSAIVAGGGGLGVLTLVTVTKGPATVVMTVTVVGVGRRVVVTKKIPVGTTTVGIIGTFFVKVCCTRVGGGFDTVEIDTVT